MRKRLILGSIIFSLTTGALAYAVWVHSFGAWEPIQHFEPIDRQAHTEPDYSGTVIPPNIAPLNFLIAEPGVAFCAKISSQKGEPIEVFSGDGAIEIPQRPWRDLLGRNKGQDLHVEVFVKNEQDGPWHRFQSTRSLIAQEDIDGYLVYRKMPATHLRVRGEMGIYCRNLSTFAESVVLRSTSYENGCLNCHAFPQNNGNKMLLGVRSTKYGVGTLLVDDGVWRSTATRANHGTHGQNPRTRHHPPQPTGEALAKVFRGHGEIPVSMPVTMATPSASRNTPVSAAWQEQRE